MLDISIVNGAINQLTTGRGTTLYPLVMTNIANWKTTLCLMETSTRNLRWSSIVNISTQAMAIEAARLSIQYGWSFHMSKVYQRVSKKCISCFMIRSKVQDFFWSHDFCWSNHIKSTIGFVARYQYVNSLLWTMAQSAVDLPYPYSEEMWRR